MIAAMARQLRLEFPGALYHLTARGNAREAIYRDDVDRKLFLALLGREIEQQEWQCYAYCLMDNHYNLLIETPAQIGHCLTLHFTLPHHYRYESAAGIRC
jgi:REP element-mobilizing transposase RayT